MNINFIYINLEESTERRLDMETKLSKYKHKRFDAIDINSPIYIKYKNNNRIPDYHKQKPNFVCCLLSHLYTVKMAYDDQLEEVIILEDDANLSILDEIYNNLDKIWYRHNDYVDVLQLYCSSQYFYKKITDIRINQWMEDGVCFDKWKPPYQWSTTGILYSKNGINSIMKLYKDGYFDISKYRKPYLVADRFIYENTNSYSLKFPIIYEDKKYISTLGHTYDYKYIDHYLENNRKHIIQFLKDFSPK